MNMHRRFPRHSNPAAVQDAFERDGVVIFEKLKLAGLEPLRRQLRDLVQLKLEAFDPGHEVTLDTLFDDALPAVHRHDRGDFVHIYEAAHALPGLFGLCADPEIGELLHLVGIDHPTMNLPPRLRMDFPNEDEFILPDHQDRHYNGGSNSSVTLWIPLAPVTRDMGPLGLRPGSHRLGSLPYRTLDRRPYLRLEPGAWETEYPVIEPTLECGEAVVFHMDLIHRSGRNRSARPRVAVQLRYDDLADPEFRGQGWPTPYTFTIKPQEAAVV